MFFNNNVRDYEVSIWTLQDSFITVLKHSKQESKGAIQNPIMNIKNDGTLEFSFSLPMYIYDGPDRIENPIWYNIRNGTIISDLRKIKVIFNKLTQLEEVFEFVITQVTERHENDELMCDVQCEGLAFHELGKIGYRISLNQDDYIQEWQDWSNSDKSTPEPKNNIDYWLKKVLKDSKWRYTIAMDWSSYDGMVTIKLNTAELPLVDFALVDIARLIKESDWHGKIIPYEELNEAERARVNERRTEMGLRRNDIIYEDEYVSSWQNTDGVMMPKTVERRREKCRLINKEGSNIYNLTQIIAETFGVYCKYVYHYDEDYHIIDREIVFYNNVLHDAKGEYQLTYPYDTKHIERTMDGTDIVTKMYVQNLTDANMESGYATIMDTDANSSGEDYLLNFDYLYSIGTISQDQYDEIPKHIARLHDLNESMKPVELELIAYQNEYTEVSAAMTIAKNAIALDTEQISAADDLRNALTEGTGVLEVTIGNPDQLIVQQDEYGMYYTIIRKEGLDGTSIHLYKKYDTKIPMLSEEITEFSPEYDEYHNLTGKLTYLPMESIDSNIIYATYTYSPAFAYDNVRQVWMTRKVDDEQEYDKQSARARVLDGTKDSDGNRLTDGLIQTAEKTLASLREQKQAEIRRFERLMGPALREGTWKPEDDYAQYGEKHTEDFVFDYTTHFNDSIISGGWDSELFDGELVNYYEEGAAQTKVYYPCVMVAEGGYAESGHYQFERFTDESLKQVTGEDITVTDLSFIFQDLPNALPNPLNYRYFPIGSSSQLGFVRKKGRQETIPVLMITGAKTLVDPSIIKNQACIGYLKTIVADDGQSVRQEVIEIIPKANIVWIPDNELASYEVIYPRIRIDSPNLKNSDDELSILRNGSLLTKYKDYSVMTRGDTVNGQYRSRYYITIKPEAIFRAGTLYNIIRGNFTIPNTGLIIYLDAIQVLKENAYPQVSYTIDPSIFNMDFVQQIYRTLNQIVRINDADLKFENVRGYISELELDLDHPAEDSMTITNYKTKFEDLFATIVAQTEEMKKNSNVLGVASRLFTETGQLSAEAIQGAFYRPDLQLAFNQGTLTIDEANGIWGTSDSGVVAFRGGGIFTATQKDSNGDWLWNTGILPSGISANAITSGQLDTNLIRIYAGDNLKFQLNGDGLYAYKSWLEDNIDSSLSGAAEAKDTRAEGYSKGVLHPGQYVVHNDDGLFLVAKKDAQVIMNDGERVWYDIVNQDVNRVEISWDGLIIRNWDNEKVFYADTLGNLTVKGRIEASELLITDDEGNMDDIHHRFEVLKDGIVAKYSSALDQAKEDMKTFTNGIKDDLQQQIDNQLETYYLNGAPTLNNAPAVEWTTNEQKDNHVGDLYYDKDTGYTYRFNKNADGSYEWVRIKDKEIEDAMKAAAAAKDVADGKRRVFYGTDAPTPPYDRGDLWVQGSAGDILRCDTPRKQGEVGNVSDWVLASKYTDNTKLDNWIENTYNKQLGEIEEQIDQKVETWYQNTAPGTLWKTDDLKKKHVNDLWYDTTPGVNKYYIYVYEGGEYKWKELDIDPPQEVFNQINGRAQIFVGDPNNNYHPAPPYHVGDLWFQTSVSGNSTGEILTCIKDSLDSYNANDWIKKNKYTDTATVNSIYDSKITVTKKELESVFTRQSDFTAFQSEIRQTAESIEQRVEGVSTIEYVQIQYCTANYKDHLEGNETWTASLETVPSGKYIWQRTATKYKDKVDIVYSNAFCISGTNGKDGSNGAPGAQGPTGPQGPAGANGENGEDGKDGISVSSVRAMYRLHTSNTSAPAKPSSASALNGWTYAYPTPQDNRYLWTCTETIFTNGTRSYSTPVYDVFANEAYEANAYINLNKDNIDLAVKATVGPNNSLSQLSVKVGSIESTVSGFDGRISTVEQTASGISSKVNTAPNVSDNTFWTSFNQTANGFNFVVGSLKNQTSSISLNSNSFLVHLPSTGNMGIVFGYGSETASVDINSEGIYSKSIQVDYIGANNIVYKTYGEKSRFVPDTPSDLQRFINDLKDKFLLGDIYIDAGINLFSNTGGNILFYGIQGTGSITLHGGEYSRIAVVNCSVYIYLEGVLIRNKYIASDEETKVLLDCTNSKIYCYNCTFQGEIGIRANHGGIVATKKCGGTTKNAVMAIESGIIILGENTSIVGTLEYDGGAVIDPWGGTHTAGTPDVNTTYRKGQSLGTGSSFIKVGIYGSNQYTSTSNYIQYYNIPPVVSATLTLTRSSAAGKGATITTRLENSNDTDKYLDIKVMPGQTVNCDVTSLVGTGGTFRINFSASDTSIVNNWGYSSNYGKYYGPSSATNPPLLTYTYR